MIFLDTLQNLVSGVGTAKDKARGWRHVHRPLTQQEIEAAYAGDWLARKIVDVPPGDMTREWRTWQSDRAEDIYAAEKFFKIKSKVKRALILRRLHGGAAILIGDGSPNPEEPFEPDRMRQGGLKYVHVFSPWEVTPADPITSIDSVDYGLPQFYSIRAESTRSSELRKIHRSRFVILVGQESPPGLATSNWGWGQPLYQSILDAINNVNTTAANAASLTEEAKTDVIQMDDLGNYLSTQEGTKRLITRFTTANTLKGLINTLVLGKGETFQRNSIQFAGLTDLMRTHAEFVSGAADVPMTRLFGTSPAGMNATGESDIRNYYDRLRSEQTTDLQDAIEPLDHALLMHVTGKRDKKDVYEWNELWQLSESERADIGYKKAQANQIYANMGAFAPEEIRGAVSDQLIDDGWWPTLDEHLLKEDDFLQIMAPEPDPSLDPQTGGRDPTGRPQLRVVGADGRWSNDADPFDPAEHPRGAGGKFSNKYSTKPKPLSHGPQGGGGKLPYPSVPHVYPAAGSWAEVVKRINKRLSQPAAKNAKYRAYIGHLIKEAEHVGGVLPPETKAALTKKIGESFFQEGALKQSLNLAAAGKLFQQAKAYGYEPKEPASPGTAAPSATKPLAEKPPQVKSTLMLSPDQEANLTKGWASDLTVAERSKVKELFKQKGGTESEWNDLEMSEKAAWALQNVPPDHLISKVLTALDPAFEKLHPRGAGGKFAAKPEDPETAWNKLTTAQKDLAEKEYVEILLSTYYEGQLSIWQEAHEEETGEFDAYPSTQEQKDLREKARQLAVDDWKNMSLKGKVNWIKSYLSPENELVKAVGGAAQMSGEPLAPKPSNSTPSADQWQKVGGQKGSNPGGTYEDDEGERWYVKTPKTGEHVVQDLLANSLYHAAGIDVTTEKAVMLADKPSIASKIVPGQVLLSEASASKRQAARLNLREGFAVDAWLGNWDVVGLSEDNVLVSNTGKPVRLDTGGTLEFRAQGEKKTLFSGTVEEFDTLRDPKLNPQAAAVFKDMSSDELVASINKVLVISDQQIKEAVLQSGAGAHLAQVLIDRRNYLANKKAGLIGQAAPKPDVSDPSKDEPLPATLTPEQQKAVKSTPFPDSHSVGTGEHGAQASKNIQAFNAKWANKEIATIGQLTEKMADFKKLKDDNLILQAKAEEAKAKVAKEAAEKAAEAEKEKLGLNDPKIKQAFAALAALTSHHNAKSYVSQAEVAAKSAGLDKYVTPVEAATIRAYTGGEVYGKLNQQLRDNSATEEAFKYAIAFEVALRKLPPYTKETTRKTNIPPSEDKKFQPGRVHVEYGFMSSSKDPYKWHGQHVLHITKSLTGVDVTKLSSHPSESEVIYPRNTAFLITKRQGNEIWMEEIETFKHLLSKDEAFLPPAEPEPEHGGTEALRDRIETWHSDGYGNFSWEDFQDLLAAGYFENEDGQ